MRINKSHATAPAFTLIELILVMALLGILMAIAVPNLARSLRDRKLDDEAKRFLAATEYCRSEAVSQGIPMVLWIEPSTGHFGVRTKDGYIPVHDRSKEFSLNEDVHFEVPDSNSSSFIAAEMAPDGTIDSTSVDSVQLIDRFHTSATVNKTDDDLGYELAKPSQ
jgi:prepilin-type N-terminal cleavage/methylation domain-containing protein